jgi:Integrase core domain
MTGVDDHSRYCVIASLVARARGRAVCLAFASALREFGVPDECSLTFNGKQFADRFGKGGGVLFDRISRDNEVTHQLTQPRHPTTTGKVERFHGSLRRELTDAVPLADLAGVQAAVDEWIRDYNTRRPHQAIGMKTPAERFRSARAMAERALRLPTVISLAPIPALPAEPVQPAAEERRQPRSSWSPSRRSPSAGSMPDRSSPSTSPPRRSRSTSTTRTAAPSASPRSSQSAASRPRSPAGALVSPGPRGKHALAMSRQPRPGSDRMAAEAGSTALPVAGNRVGPGEAMRQDPTGCPALRGHAARLNRMRKRRAVADERHIGIIITAAQRERRVPGHNASPPLEPHLVLQASRHTARKAVHVS